MTSSDKGTMNLNINCNHFGAIDFGINVHLIVHTDDYSVYSVESVHQSGHLYKLNNNILACLSFSRLGMAVALRVGNVLIFNAHEPHLISRQCINHDVVYFVSAYPKTDVVYLNDNSIELSSMMESLNKIYH